MPFSLASYVARTMSPAPLPSAPSLMVAVCVPSASMMVMVVTLPDLLTSTVGEMPSAPLGPVGPVAPCGPCKPCGPVSPRGPCGPCGPVAPVAPVAPAGPCGPIIFTLVGLARPLLFVHEITPAVLTAGVNVAPSYSPSARFCSNCSNASARSSSAATRPCSAATRAASAVSRASSWSTASRISSVLAIAACSAASASKSSGSITGSISSFTDSESRTTAWKISEFHTTVSPSKISTCAPKSPASCVAPASTVHVQPSASRTSGAFSGREKSSLR